MVFKITTFITNKQNSYIGLITDRKVKQEINSIGGKLTGDDLLPAILISCQTTCHEIARNRQRAENVYSSDSRNYII